MADRKVVKVPVILQMEALECGAASLAMVLAYYHKWVPLDQVRVECGVSRDGSSALNILKAARRYGMECRAKRYTVERLREAAGCPAILFWGMNHFVVLDGFRGDSVYLNDPARGRVHMPVAEFRKYYSGICLELAPGEAFVADGRRKPTVDFLRSGLSGNGRVVGIVMLTSALAAAAGALIPVFSRIFTDEILGGGRQDWFHGFLLFFAAAILFQLVASVINQTLIIRATGKLAVKANAKFMHHLFRMPMQFFSQRMSGDLANRQAANDTVAATLITKLAPTLINLLMLLFYLFVMIRYSAVLTAVGILTVAINLIVAQIITRKRIDISSAQMRDQAKLDAETVSGISMVETIKAAGAESGFFERWSGFHASVIRAKTKFVSVNCFLGTLPALLQELSNTAVLAMGFWLMMEGRFTAGLLLAFQSFMAAFLKPVNELIAAGQSLEEMRFSLDRIQDVLEYPEDDAFGREVSPDDLEDAKKLSGLVEMKNVTFGYSKLAEPLIRDFNLNLTPGKRVAFVGASGSGKSTIAKLLTGLYQPWSGEILFDGKPISAIPRAVFKRSLAMVNQEVILFSDTVENNIKMWDDSIEDFDMILAAKDADIHADIISRKDGYQRVLQEGGRDLSGGQRQRIEIARVLAVDPSIIILDEATSALDARTEYDVSRFIHDRGITCIIVAHRLSTVRDCDEILVMDHGEVVQRGTHEVLMQEEGLYRTLITTE
ncbi:MAG: NHLP family bacteriocin export ABC transporter peptidase/permease/ATPase subunit [Clostridia bacterium]|nr:NHLP family bacteriocin export ABC transporter peptidase/permease/ATPase subunit [Clostridia bacterium]